MKYWFSIWSARVTWGESIYAILWIDNANNNSVTETNMKWITHHRQRRCEGRSSRAFRGNATGEAVGYTTDTPFSTQSMLFYDGDGEYAHDVTTIYSNDFMVLWQTGRKTYFFAQCMLIKLESKNIVCTVPMRATCDEMRVFMRSIS